MTSVSSSSQQQYGQRNLFYLRVSPTIVLPCILYLDARHVTWLNTHPSVFHSALGFLKDRIMPKLEREAKVVIRGAKNPAPTSAGPSSNLLGRGRGGFEKRLWGQMSGKEEVDIVKRPEFHLAYFFKKQSERHAVLLKEKKPFFPGQSGAANGARKGGHGSNKRRRAEADDAGNDEQRNGEPGNEALGGISIKPDPEDEEVHQPLSMFEVDEGSDGGQGEPQDTAPVFDGNEGEEEQDEKPKFRLRVRYKGFSVFGKSLILVLEPSPSARARSPHLFAIEGPAERRQLSVTPAVGPSSSSAAYASRDRSRSSVSLAPQSSLGRGAGGRFDAAAADAGGGGSMRNASRTPLFRGSLTPSEAGGEEEIEERRGERLDMRRRTPLVEHGRQQEMTDQTTRGESAGPEAEAEVGDESEEEGFNLAARMLSSQSGIAAGGVDDRDAGAED